MLDYPTYFLDDQYMTVRQYDLEEKADVLGSEKQEIVTRVQRVKSQPQVP